MIVLDLKKPGKLAATAEYAKTFTFYLVKAPYETCDLETGEKVKPDDVIFTKENVAATQQGPTARAGLVDLAPEQKKLADRLDELEKKLKVPIHRVYAYCVATSEEGERKLAAECELKINRPELDFKVKEPAKIVYNYADPTKNILSVEYEAVNEVKSVEQQSESDDNFKFDKDRRTAKGPDRIAGVFTFKADKPGMVDVPITATSSRESVQPVTKYVTLEAEAITPEITLTPAKDGKARVGEATTCQCTLKGVERVELKLEPADVFSLGQAAITGSTLLQLMPKKEGTAVLKATGYIGKGVVTEATADLEAGLPKLEVSGDKTVGVNLEAALTVEMANLDDVQITLEPAGVVSIDKPQLTKSDVVKVKGIQDGKVKVTARGRLGTAEAKVVSYDIESLGPVLAVTKLAYRGIGE